MRWRAAVRTRPPAGRLSGLPLATTLLSILIGGCGAGAAIQSRPARPGTIGVVGAESQYANVLAAVGGRYVSATAVMSNPNADPHSFEASTSIARTISSARLIVQNGLGYDSFMNKLESASSNRSRRIIDVQLLLGLPASTSNPHLWYAPGTMARVAAAAAAQLARLLPAQARYFHGNARRFASSLTAVDIAIARFRHAHGGAPVASTEPVADYLLAASGVRNLTPWNLQVDLMNGVDPAPQDLTAEDDLLQGRRVRAIVYNRQVTDPVTQSFLQQAAEHHVPEVAVYETLPAGYDYRSWMLAELAALNRALTSGRSTRRLGR